MLFNEVDEIKGKIRGEILLSADQKIVLLKNFDSVCSTLSLKDAIDDEDVKKEILLNLDVRRHIVGGANRTLISVNTSPRLCRIGTYRRLSAG